MLSPYQQRMMQALRIGVQLHYMSGYNAHWYITDYTVKCI